MNWERVRDVSLKKEKRKESREGEKRRRISKRISNRVRITIDG